jgi:hypothetical protein
MNKFQKLAQLNKDIELLEAYGDFKSASILHKKFVKEAQELKNIRNTDPYNKVFDKYIEKANANPSVDLIEAVKRNGFLYKEDQDQLASYISSKLNPVKPTNKPTDEPTDEPTNEGPKQSSITSITQPEFSSAKINDSYSNFDSKLESKLNPSLAPAIKYPNFSLFAEPISQIVKPYATKPEKPKKDETVKVQPADSASAKLDVMVRNFWDRRYVPGKKLEDVYQEIKKDSAKITSLRNHIRASNHPEKDQILKLYNEKVK